MHNSSLELKKSNDLKRQWVDDGIPARCLSSAIIECGIILANQSSTIQILKFVLYSLKTWLNIVSLKVVLPLGGTIPFGNSIPELTSFSSPFTEYAALLPKCLTLPAESITTALDAIEFDANIKVVDGLL